MSDRHWISPGFAAFLALWCVRYPLSAILVFAAIVIHLWTIPALRANAGEGVPGTYTATHRVCSGNGDRGCEWHGDFVSDNGREHFDNVLLAGDTEGDLKPGVSVRALDTGRPDGVYRQGASYWMTPLITIIICTAILVPALMGWAFWIRGLLADRSRRGRRVRW